MKRLLAGAAMLLALTGAAHADDHGKAASDHGFATVSLEVYCKGILTVAARRLAFARGYGKIIS